MPHEPQRSLCGVLLSPQRSRQKRPRSGNNHRANSQSNTPRSVCSAQPTMQPTTLETSCYTGASSLPEKQTTCENSARKRSGERSKTVPLFLRRIATPRDKGGNVFTKVFKVPAGCGRLHSGPLSKARTQPRSPQKARSKRHSAP